MKIKVLDYFTISELKINQKNILDVQIIDGEEGILINKKFINKDTNLSFIIKSVGHVNPPVENYYPLTVEINVDSELKDYKDLVFSETI